MAFGDPEYKQKKDDAKTRIKQKIADYRNCFGTESGEKVLDDLRKFCRKDSITHVQNDPYGRNSAFYEGQRNVILYIEACMNQEQIKKLEEMEKQNG